MTNSSQDFLKFVEENKHFPMALESASRSEDYIKLHKDKVDVKLMKMILGKGMADNEWLNVPSSIGSLYMLYLAGNIAKNNGLELSTDKSEAWCGRNFFEFNGKIDTHMDEKDKYYLCALTISNFVPNTILNLSPRDLIKFRKDSEDERSLFYKSIQKLIN